MSIFQFPGGLGLGVAWLAHLLTVLISGHSSVRRLSSDLLSNFDACASEQFDLVGDAVIHLHGVGGRTVEKRRLFDLGVVSALRPDIIILEIGTKDLFDDRPEVVGSEIDDLVQLLLASYSVRVIGLRGIAFLEFYPIALSLHLWGHAFKDQRVLFFTDNEALVHVINKQTCRDKDLMFFVRKLVLVCLHCNICLKQSMFQAYRTNWLILCLGYSCRLSNS